MPDRSDTPPRRLAWFPLALDDWEHPDGVLAAYVVTAPDDHPLWDQYLLSVGTLKPCVCENRRHRGALHTMRIGALHPDYPAAPDAHALLVPLHPDNIRQRLYHLDDAGAVRVLERLVDLLRELDFPLDPAWHGGRAEDYARDVIARLAYRVSHGHDSDEPTAMKVMEN